MRHAPRSGARSGLAGLIDAAIGRFANMPFCRGLCDTRRADYRRAMRLALYQPESAGNVGTILRLAACLGVRGRPHRALRLRLGRPSAEARGHGLCRRMSK